MARRQQATVMVVLATATFLGLTVPVAYGAYSRLKMAYAMETCLKQAENQFKPENGKDPNALFCDRNSDVYSSTLRCLATATKADGDQPASKPEDTKGALQSIMAKVCPGAPWALPTANLELPTPPDSDKQPKDQKLAAPPDAPAPKGIPQWLWPMPGSSGLYVETFPKEFDGTGYSVPEKHNKTLGCGVIGAGNRCIAAIAVTKNDQDVEELIKIGLPGSLDSEIDTFARLKEAKSVLPFMSTLIKNGTTASGLQYLTTQLWGKNMQTRLEAGQVKPRNFWRMLKSTIGIIRRSHNAGLAHGALDIWNLAVNSKAPKELKVFGFGQAVAVTRENAGGCTAMREYLTILRVIQVYGEKLREGGATSGQPNQNKQTIAAFEDGAAAQVELERYNPVSAKFFAELPPGTEADCKNPKKELPENRFKQARLFTYLDQVHYEVLEGLQLDKFDAGNKECLYTEADKAKRDEAAQAGQKCPDPTDSKGQSTDTPMAAKPKDQPSAPKAAHKT